MKLSDAMMLGDVIMSRSNDTWVNRERNCGCALGRAYIASGGKEASVFQVTIANMWPWLNEVNHYISGRFSGVCAGSQTFESLVEHVRSIEPSCGDCNRFVCSCVKAETADAPIEVLVGAA